MGNIPDVYLPLCEGDLVQIDGHDAVVIEPDSSGLIVIQLMVNKDDLVWVGRLRTI